MESLLQPFNAYVYGTSMWYAIRAFVRLVAPETVYGWFKAGSSTPTSLEVYNIRTDAFGLALCALLVFLIPQLPASSSSTTAASKSGGASPRVVALLGTVLQHLGTAYYAYFQWADASTTTGAMLLGWAVSLILGTWGTACAVMGSHKTSAVSVKKTR